MLRTSVCVGAMAVAGVGLAGCALPGHYEGGSFYSSDKHVYVSRPHLPTTVSVIDTRTEETVWTLDVPVGKKLVMYFQRDRYKDDPAMPDRLRWGLLKGDVVVGGVPDDNFIPVPPASARRLKVDYRTAPEYPPGADPQPAEETARAN